VSRARPEIEICVVGIDDAEWGQRVVLATTDPDLALADVRAVVTAELPAFHAPKNLVRVREFPRTSIGKIRRRELSRQVALALSGTT
jgi:acyl-CoA synthetase (AMP-forming)/AMP-acid ligase II